MQYVDKKVQERFMTDLNPLIEMGYDPAVCARVYMKRYVRIADRDEFAQLVYERVEEEIEARAVIINTHSMLKKLALAKTKLLALIK